MLGPKSADQTLARLQDQGYRLTRPRRAIVGCLFDAGAWLRPEDVLARARRQCPTLGLVTVYRTLELLEGLGAVRRVHGRTGCQGYALASVDDGHYIVCRDCRQVVEFEGCDVDRVVRRVARRTGFRIEAHMLELVGLCPACGRRTSAPSPRVAVRGTR
jgi:Fur family ferric uptake transcriptional regulator